MLVPAPRLFHPRGTIDPPPGLGYRGAADMLPSLRSIVGFVLRSPLLELLAIWPLLAMTSRRAAWRPARGLLVGLVLLVAGLKLAIYLGAPTLLDHNATQFVCVGRRWLDGMPLYHALDSPYRYALLYGPAPYLLVASILAVVPQAVGLVTVKLGFIACWLGAIALTARAARGAGAALVVAAASLALGRLAYTVRADAVLMVAAAAGLWLAVRGLERWPRGLAAAGIGIAAGIALGFQDPRCGLPRPRDRRAPRAERGRIDRSAPRRSDRRRGVAVPAPGRRSRRSPDAAPRGAAHGLSPYLLALNASVGVFLLLPAAADRERRDGVTRARRGGLLLATAPR